MNDPAGALVRRDPVPDLHERELEDADVDDVARTVADLDPITDLEGPAPHDEHPPGQIGHQVLERDGQAGGEQAQVGGDRLEAFEPDAADDQKDQERGDIGAVLLPLVARADVLEAGEDGAQDEPPYEPHQEDHQEGQEDLLLDHQAYPKRVVCPLLDELHGRVSPCGRHRQNLGPNAR